MTLPKLNAFITEFLSALPASLQPVKSEFEAKLQQGISEVIQKMDLVTRQEFDVQTQVLAKTRKLLQSLEVQVRQLEATPVLDSSKTEL